MTAKYFRYPGVKPFESADNQLFFGRTQDIEGLLDIILLEKITVLFGKSGYGKSSLINAGIFPLLEKENILPIFVRMGSYIAGKSLPPLENLQLWIDKTWENSTESNFLSELNLTDNLWLRFKRKQNAKQMRFLLVFDQFEEFFTHPLEAQALFKKQIADLLYTEIPQQVRDKMENLPEEQARFLANPYEVKVLFSIRSDRMSSLDSMKSDLPAILHKRYELKGLTRSQAQEAIEKPAALQSDKFLSPSFSYAPAALNHILDKLSSTKIGSNATIEAFQLQILCQYIEEKKVIEGGILHIDAKDLPDISNIYEAYYKRQLAKLPDAEQNLAHKIIEEGLLFEDEATGEARRLSVDSDVLQTNFGSCLATLLKLQDSFLLRREANTLGGFNYEISHDTLIQPIQKSRAENRKKQANLENERKQQEANLKAQAAMAQAEKEKKLRENAEKARKRASVLSVIACVALIIAIWQWRQADNQLERNYKITAAHVHFKLKYFTADSIFAYQFGYLHDAAKADMNIPAGHKYKNEQTIKNKYAELIAWFLTCGRGNQHQLEKANLKRAYGLVEKAYEYLDKPVPKMESDTVAYLDKCYHGLADAETQNALDKRLYYPEMIAVKGDTFRMGNFMRSVKENDLDEIPIHSVKLDDFKMGKTEVTVWQYFLFCEITGYQKPLATRFGWNGENPIVNVSWYDAMQYCQWLSSQEKIRTKTELTPSFSYKVAKMSKEARDTLLYQPILDKATGKWQGNGYRLPTEAEWEYAGRLAQTGVSYAYEYAGCNLENIQEYAWIDKNSQNQPQPVAKLKPNGMGLYDMSGNVYEWCFDAYDALFYEKSKGMKNNLNIINTNMVKNERVLRSGSWFGAANKCRIANRLPYTAHNNNDNFGFRVCR